MNISPVNKHVFRCQRSKFSAKEELDAMLELGAFHYPLDKNVTDMRNHSTNTIRALSDMFNCNLTNFPLIVGIFAESKREDHLSKLASELHNINNLASSPLLRFSPILFLFPLVVSISLGYIVGMLTNWQVGLSIGNVAMFIQIASLVVIITGSKFFNQRHAVIASQTVVRFLNWIRLLLNVSFCYPTHPLDTRAPVRTVIVYHRLYLSSTPNVAIFSMIDKMWTELIRLYGQLPIRLQRCFKPPTNPKQRYKRFRCLPAFVMVTAFWIAFMVTTGILRYNSGHLDVIFSHGALTIIFVMMSSVIFLSVLGSLFSLCRIFRGLATSPVKPLRLALSEFVSEETDTEEAKQLRKKHGNGLLGRSAGQVNELIMLDHSSLKNLAINAAEEQARKADLKIKEEFGKLCTLLTTFDSFLHQNQTRFIVCLDAGEINQREVLAKLIYQVHSLFLCEVNSPVAVVIEADFRVLLGEMTLKAIWPTDGESAVSLHTSGKTVCQTLSDNVHLVHTSVHLPIYLDTPIFTESEFADLCRHRDDITCSMGTSNEHFPKQSSDFSSHQLAHQSSVISRESGHSIFELPLIDNSVFDESKFHNPVAGIHSTCTLRQNSISRTNSNASKITGGAQGIAGLFLKDHDLADWNRKVIKSLVAATAFTNRLLRLCNLDVSVEDLVLWITLVHYWPYHTAWLILVLEEHFRKQNRQIPKQHRSDATTIKLVECLSQVKCKVSSTVETFGPLITDDRDLDKLEYYLQRRAYLSVTSAKKLISCVLMHNPFLRRCILAFTNQLDRDSHTRYHISQHHREPMSFIYSKFNGRYHPETEDAYAEHSIDQQFRSKSFEKNKPIPTETPDKGVPRSKLLEELSTVDVCRLLSKIPNMSPNRLRHYQNRVACLCINGNYLRGNDQEKIRHEMSMTAPDWYWFNGLISRFKRKFSDISVTPDSFENWQNNLPRARNDDSSVVIQNIHVDKLENRHFKTDPESMVYSGRPETKIRQTPWLLSPQVSTGPMASEISTSNLTDPRLLHLHQEDQHETQTSLSGMEEPESLWIQTLPVHAQSPVFIHHTPSSMLSGRSGDEEQLPNTNMVEGSFATNGHHSRASSKKQKELCDKHTEALFAKKQVLSNVEPSPYEYGQKITGRQNRSNQYDDKSTIDLTAVGPFCSKTHEHKSFSNELQPAENEISSIDSTYQEFAHRLNETNKRYIHTGTKFRSLHSGAKEQGMHIQNMWTDTFPSKSEPEFVNEEQMDLRKMRKRPCRRIRPTTVAQYKLKPISTDVHCNFVRSHKSDFQQVGYAKNLHSSNLFDSKIDTRRVYKGHHGTKYSVSPTYAQLNIWNAHGASVRATGTCGCMRNSFPDHSTLCKSHPFCSALDTRGHQPVCNAVCTAHNHTQNKRGKFEYPASLDYASAAESNDDNEQLCTCHYWYAIEKSRSRMALSEPTLRGHSDDLSTSTPSPDELQMLTKGLEDKQLMN